MRRKRWLWFTGVAVLIVVVVIYRACYWRTADTASVKQLLDQHISVSMSSDSVVRVLDSLKIEHSAVDPKDGHMSAAVRNVARSGFVTADILIHLQFDSERRLRGYSIEEAYTGF